MRKVLLLPVLILLLILPVSAAEYEAPLPPEDVQQLLPKEEVSFGSDLWKIVTSAMDAVAPSLAQGGRICLALVASAILISLLGTLPGNGAKISQIAGVLVGAVLLLGQTNSMVHLAAETVRKLSDYGKLLLPVMTAALASQGGITASAALYTGTAAFDALLSHVIAKALVPVVYGFLILSLGAAATNDALLGKIRDLLKWLATWCLKTVLYIFTGYMGITGVVSGTADVATMKATKLTLSGMIPVVGGILSDASEAVIVGAGVMKSAVGVYGLLAIIAIWITPFLQIGVQYWLLKLTVAVCTGFEAKGIGNLLQSFTTALGLLLAMTGAVCIMLLVSIVCFMKGVS